MDKSPLASYLYAIKRSLQASLCLRNFASEEVERHNKPEIETNMSKRLIGHPITIARSNLEKVLIETSINSSRISIKIKQADDVEEVLVKMFTRFIAQRADQFRIVRRKPIEGYDISFLITNIHVEEMILSKVIDFLITFLLDIDKEISYMKVTLNKRARNCGEEFLKVLI